MAEGDLDEITAACYVRAPVLLEPVDAHVETLRTCEREGIVDGLVLRSWPEAVRLDKETPHREVVERFEEFERWADRRGVSVRPPFEVRSGKSLTGEHRERLVTPLVCLALYDVGRLLGVYPHSAGEETYTIEDAIATVRTGEFPTPLAGPERADSATDACPECDGRLVNGQGLFACADCGWVGTVARDGRYEELSEEGEVPTAPN
jgi:hypothetical protein